MKKIILILTLLSSIFLAKSQCPSACPTPPSCIQNGNLSAPSTSGNVNWQSTTLVNDWFVSHGTPSLASNNSIFLWGSFGHGEGIFTCFDFDSTKTYQICIRAKYLGNTQDGDLFIKATFDGLTQPILPIPNHGQNIPSTCNGIEEVIGITNIIDDNYQIYTYTYSPSSNYNQLWLYPEERIPIGGGISQQYSLIIDDVHIEEINSSLNPSLNIITSGNSSNGTPLTLTATGAPTGANIIWSTKEIGNSISIIPTCYDKTYTASYSYCPNNGGLFCNYPESTITIKANDCCGEVYDSVYCQSNTPQLDFKLKNLSNFNATGYTMHKVSTNTIVGSDFSSNILIGDYSTLYTIDFVSLGMSIGDFDCFYYKLFNSTDTCITDTICISMPDCINCCGNWNSIAYYDGVSISASTDLLGNPTHELTEIQCNDTIDNSFKDYIYIDYDCNEYCSTGYSYSWQNSSGNSLNSGNQISDDLIIDISFFDSLSLPNDIYCLSVMVICGDSICDSCIICVDHTTVPPPKMCCGNWNPITYYDNDSNSINQDFTISCEDTLSISCDSLDSIVLKYSCSQMLNNSGEGNYCDTVPNGYYSKLYNPNGVLENTYYGNTISSLPLLINGVYRLTSYSICDTSVCDSCNIYLNVLCEPILDDCCIGSNPPQIEFKDYFNDTIIPYNCDAKIPVDCGNKFVLNFSYDGCNDYCSQSELINIYNQSGNILGTYANGIDSIHIPTTGNGQYIYDYKKYCAGNLCDSCIITLEYGCDTPPVSCCGQWNDVQITSPSGYHNTIASSDINGSLIDLYPPCGEQATLNLNYDCDSNCTASSTFRTTYYNQDGSVNSSFNSSTAGPFFFNVNQVSSSVTYVYCGDTLVPCDSLLLSFTVQDCDTPPVSCCGQWNDVQITSPSGYHNTIASSDINGSLIDLYPPCGEQATLNLNYDCDPNCTASSTFRTTYYNQDGSVNSSFNSSTAGPFFFNVNQVSSSVTYVYCGDTLVPCDSLLLSFTVQDCDTPPVSCCGQWNDVQITSPSGYHNTIASGDINGTLIDLYPPCDEQATLNLNYDCDPNCTASSTFRTTYYNQDGSVNSSFNSSTAGPFFFNVNQVSSSVTYVYCGDTLVPCDSLLLSFTVQDCDTPPVSCCGQWNDVQITSPSGYHNTIASSDINGSLIDLYPPCGEQATLNLNYDCDPNCTASSTFRTTYYNQDGSVNSSFNSSTAGPFFFNVNQVSSSVTYVYCGDTLVPCDSLLLSFTVQDCDTPPVSCCGQWNDVQITSPSGYHNTIASSDINGSLIDLYPPCGEQATLNLNYDCDPNCTASSTFRTTYYNQDGSVNSSFNSSTAGPFFFNVNQVSSSVTYVYCGDTLVPCDSLLLSFTVQDCDTPPVSCCGQWNDVQITSPSGYHNTIASSDINGSLIDLYPPCGEQATLNLNYDCDPNCTASSTFQTTYYNQDGSVNSSFNSSTAGPFFFNVNQVSSSVTYVYCGDTLVPCDSLLLSFTVQDCDTPPVSCCGQWNDVQITSPSGYHNTIASGDINGTLIDLYPPCDEQATLNLNYDCDPNCTASSTFRTTYYNQDGSVNSSFNSSTAGPFFFNVNQVSSSVTYVYCGDTLVPCDSLLLSFTVQDCDTPPVSCCGDLIEIIGTQDLNGQQWTNSYHPDFYPNGIMQMDATCDMEINLGFNYQCDSACSSNPTFETTFFTPNGTQSAVFNTQNVGPLTFNQNGIWTSTTYVYCGDSIPCDTFLFEFWANACDTPPVSCCGQWNDVQITSPSGYHNTIASSDINGTLIDLYPPCDEQATLNLNYDCDPNCTASSTFRTTYYNQDGSVNSSFNSSTAGPFFFNVNQVSSSVTYVYCGDTLVPCDSLLLSFTVQDCDTPPVSCCGDLIEIIGTQDLNGQQWTNSYHPDFYPNGIMQMDATCDMEINLGFNYQCDSACSSNPTFETTFFTPNGTQSAVFNTQNVGPLTFNQNGIWTSTTYVYCGDSIPCDTFLFEFWANACDTPPVSCCGQWNDVQITSPSGYHNTIASSDINGTLIDLYPPCDEQATLNLNYDCDPNCTASSTFQTTYYNQDGSVNSSFNSSTAGPFFFNVNQVSSSVTYVYCGDTLVPCDSLLLSFTVQDCDTPPVSCCGQWNDVQITSPSGYHNTIASSDINGSLIDLYPPCGEQATLNLNYDCDPNCTASSTFQTTYYNQDGSVNSSFNSSTAGPFFFNVNQVSSSVTYVYCGDTLVPCDSLLLSFTVQDCDTPPVSCCGQWNDVQITSPSGYHNTIASGDINGTLIDLYPPCDEQATLNLNYDCDPNCTASSTFRTTYYNQDGSVNSSFNSSTAGPFFFNVNQVSSSVTYVYCGDTLVPCDSLLLSFTVQDCDTPPVSCCGQWNDVQITSPSGYHNTIASSDINGSLIDLYPPCGEQATLNLNYDCDPNCTASSTFRTTYYNQDGSVNSSFNSSTAGPFFFNVNQVSSSVTYVYCGDTLVPCDSLLLSFTVQDCDTPPVSCCGQWNDVQITSPSGYHNTIASSDINGSLIDLYPPCGEQATLNLNYDCDPNCTASSTFRTTYYNQDGSVNSSFNSSTAGPFFFNVNQVSSSVTYVYCGDTLVPCDSLLLSFTVQDCDTPPVSCCGQWNDVQITSPSGYHNTIASSDINGSLIDLYPPCGEQATLNLNYDCDPNCTASSTFQTTYYNQDGSVNSSFNSSTAGPFFFNVNQVSSSVTYVYCGDTLVPCDSLLLSFTVQDCDTPPVSCCGQWNDVQITSPSGYHNTIASGDINGTLIDLYPPCDEQATLNLNYDCDPNCTASSTFRTTYYNQDGSVNSSFNSSTAGPFFFNVNQVSSSVTYVYCGDTLVPCDSLLLSFTVQDCDTPPVSCCGDLIEIIGTQDLNGQQWTNSYHPDFYPNGIMQMDATCDMEINLGFNYQCDSACSSNPTFETTFFTPNGTQSAVFNTQNVGPLTFNQNGIWTSTTYVYCGDSIPCDTFLFEFWANACDTPPVSCCGQWNDVQITSPSGYHNTIASSDINGTLIDLYPPCDEQATLNLNYDCDPNCTASSTFRTTYYNQDGSVNSSFNSSTAGPFFFNVNQVSSSVTYVYCGDTLVPCDSLLLSFTVQDCDTPPVSCCGDLIEIIGTQDLNGQQWTNSYHPDFYPNGIMQMDATCDMEINLGFNYQCDSACSSNPTFETTFFTPNGTQSAVFNTQNVGPLTFNQNGIWTSTTYVYCGDSIPCDTFLFEFWANACDTPPVSCCGQWNDVQITSPSGYHNTIASSDINGTLIDLYPPCDEQATLNLNYDCDPNCTASSTFQTTYYNQDGSVNSSFNSSTAGPFFFNVNQVSSSVTYVYCGDTLVPCDSLLLSFTVQDCDTPPVSCCGQWNDVQITSPSGYHNTIASSDINGSLIDLYPPCGEQATLNLNYDCDPNCTASSTFQTTYYNQDGSVNSSFNSSTAGPFFFNVNQVSSSVTYVYCGDTLVPCDSLLLSFTVQDCDTPPVSCCGQWNDVQITSPSGYHNTIASSDINGSLIDLYPPCGEQATLNLNYDCDPNCTASSTFRTTYYNQDGSVNSSFNSSTAGPFFFNVNQVSSSVTYVYCGDTLVPCDSLLLSFTVQDCDTPPVSCCGQWNDVQITSPSGYHNTIASGDINGTLIDLYPPCDEQATLNLNYDCDPNCTASSTFRTTYYNQDGSVNSSFNSSTAGPFFFNVNQVSSSVTYVYCGDTLVPCDSLLLSFTVQDCDTPPVSCCGDLIEIIGTQDLNGQQWTNSYHPDFYPNGIMQMDATCDMEINLGFNYQCDSACSSNPTFETTFFTPNGTQSAVFNTQNVGPLTFNQNGIWTSTTYVYCGDSIPCDTFLFEFWANACDTPPVSCCGQWNDVQITSPSGYHNTIASSDINGSLIDLYPPCGEQATLNLNYDCDPNCTASSTFRTTYYNQDGSVNSSFNSSTAGPFFFNVNQVSSSVTYVYCGDTLVPCDSLLLSFTVQDCDTPPVSCCGQWNDVQITSPSGYHNTIASGDINGTLIDLYPPCDEQATLNLNYDCDPNCTASSTFRTTYYNQDGSVNSSFNSSTAGPFFFNVNQVSSSVTYVYCGDTLVPCDSLLLSFTVQDCDTPPVSCCGDLIEIIGTQDLNGQQWTNSYHPDFYPNGIMQMDATCDMEINLGFNYQCDSACSSNPTFETTFFTPNGTQSAVFNTQNVGPLTFNQNGIWTSTTYVYCGDSIPCDTFLFEFWANACDTPPVSCCGQWNDVQITSPSGYHNTIASSDINGTLIDLYPPCDEQATLNLNYDCDPNCTASSTFQTTYYNQDGSVNSSFNSSTAGPFFFNVNQVSSSVTYVYCGDTLVPCDSLLLSFTVQDCDTPPVSCCGDLIEIIGTQDLNGQQWTNSYHPDFYPNGIMQMDATCDMEINLGFNYQCDSACSSNPTFETTFFTPNGTQSAVFNTQNVGPLTFNQNGIWTSTTYVYCGDSIPCDTFLFEFWANACDTPPVSCCGQWNDVQITSPSGYHNTIASSDINGTLIDLYPPCDEQATLNLNYDCDPNCTASSTFQTTYYNQDGSVNSSFNSSTAGPFFFNVNQVSSSVTYVYCGDTLVPCDSLLLSFTVQDCDTPVVCPDDCYWKLDGNDTVTVDNFIGPINNADFKIRTNNFERMTVEANGNVGIATTSPTHTLHVEGKERITKLPVKQPKDAIVFASENPIDSGELRKLKTSGSYADYLGGDGEWHKIPKDKIGITNAAQGLSIENNTVMLGETCEKNESPFKEDRAINMNNYNLYFNTSFESEESNGKLYMGNESCKKLYTRLELGSKGITKPFKPKNSYDSPGPSTSGLRFTNLTMNDEPIENKSKGVLSLDKDGDVIWVRKSESNTFQAINKLSKKIETLNVKLENEELKIEIDQLKYENELINMKLELIEKTVLQLCENGCEGLELKSDNSDMENNNILYQSIPNPTDSKALINYYLIKDYTKAYLNIYNINGVLIEKINIKPVKGNGMIKLSLENFDNGAYTYTLYVDNILVKTRKLQVIK